MTAVPPLPATPPGRYRHYKGAPYEVLGAVRHSETLEALVLYRQLYGDGGTWVRPHAMFFGEVTVAGVVQPRFAPEGAAGPQPGGAVSQPPGTARPD